MLNNSHRVNALFQLYLNNSITQYEYQELLELLQVDTLSDSLEIELKALWEQSGNDPIGLYGREWDKKMQFLQQQLLEKEVATAPVRKLSSWYKVRWAAAAVFLLMLSYGGFKLLPSSKQLSVQDNILAKIDTVKSILPGGNKAVLILADGTSIILDSASNGTIASQGSIKVIKLNTGQLVYNSTDGAAVSVSYNTLTTPLGGQYQVTLQDGTIVWLNSGSSLRYPTAFTGAERRVEITGEAYFEVAKNPHQPFKVKINLLSGEGGEVEVLGTHFNINAYENEAIVRTTLLEGSVKVNHSTSTSQLKPGQQLQLSKQGQVEIVNKADLEETMAWKEGRFQFENADIHYVMRQIARWYDVEVEFKGDITRHFGGAISRNVNVTKVLNLLELTGEVNFKVAGKKIIVMP
jgi:ferric-dicitrate binding protein FerR (iron transport regulator)